jgi:hypothetical protein
MSSAFNPYQSPGADMTGIPGVASGPGSVTPAMLAHLSATKPWVRFLSILGVISTALMFLASIVMIVMGFVGEATMVGMGLLYLVMAVVYVLPILYLHRYANAIRQTELDGDVASVELALLCQKSFWRAVGIISAAGIALYLVVILIAVIAGVVMATSR